MRSYLGRSLSKPKYNGRQYKVGVIKTCTYAIFCWEVFLKVLREKVLRHFEFSPRSSFWESFLGIMNPNPKMMGMILNFFLRNKFLWVLFLSNFPSHWKQKTCTIARFGTES